MLKVNFFQPHKLANEGFKPTEDKRSGHTCERKLMGIREEWAEEKQEWGGGKERGRQRDRDAWSDIETGRQRGIERDTQKDTETLPSERHLCFQPAAGSHSPNWFLAFRRTLLREQELW